MTSIAEPADRLAIADAIARLAATQDARDWAGLRGVLADHVRLDLSAHLGTSPVELSAEAFVEKARAVANTFTSTHHMTANLVIELSVDQAACRCHVVAYHHFAQAPEPCEAACIMRGTWDVRLHRVGEAWLIAELTVARTVPLEGNADFYPRTATSALRG
ncbi:nuclear transport factor 2 family protein [Streptomyces sp. PTM05]|uniref:Nuclear transport factor 2 family protein n=1 Tax=Streptantibioticus parmotrematis TaxID=2873249 RepID=A0ABS7R0E2_9ACTN|nr:nuclear transport factor 2 family protein [Streptantibioticus parmotrematis]MBY8888935.1 nuclear transport factor 2 family protein [Streptantibioticus parmotrematis]